MAVAPFAAFARKEINIFLLLSQIFTKGVVPMKIQKHPVITYDNYGRTYRADSSYSNDCEINKSQIKEKDNRCLLAKSAVIF